MAGETINVRGAWATLQAAASTANGAFSAGSRTVISTALSTGDEADYPLMDLKLSVSSGTPAADGLVNVYRRNKADTDESPAPDSAFKSEYLGTFLMDATASSSYYIYGLPNDDPEATLYIENQDGTSTLTIALKARGRTYKAAA